MDKLYKSSLNIEIGYESLRWFAVNTVMCQIPMIIMKLQGFSNEDILYSGLSYAVTLLIVANYTLEDFSLHCLKKTSTIFWLIICIVFLSLYKSIKIDELNLYINTHTKIIYLIFIGISNIFAFVASYSLLRSNAENKILSKAETKRKQADRTKSNMKKYQEEIVLDEGDAQ